MFAPSHMALAGLGLITLGTVIRYRIGRRRFKRRTLTGMEWFGSYSYARVLFTKAWEGFAILLAASFILIGFVLVLRGAM